MTGPTGKAHTDGDRGYWDQFGESWNGRQRDRLWRVHSDALNARLLRRWLPRGRDGWALKTDLFDEAFGEGLVQPLAERFPNLVGIDLSRAVLDRAVQGRPEIAGVRCDVRALPFADGAFAAIASISTLDHFRRASDIVAALAELRRVLAPGGRLVLTLDNPANPIVGIRNRLPFRLVNALGLVPYYVGSTAGPWRSRRLLARAGFEVLETGTLLHCPRLLAIPIGRFLQRRASSGLQRRYLLVLDAFERLSRWPTRYWTGHFVALSAVRADPLTRPAPSGELRA